MAKFLETIISMTAPTQLFSETFCKSFRNNFFKDYLQVIVSVDATTNENESDCKWLQMSASLSD